MQLIFLLLQVVAILFLPAIIRGNVDGKSQISIQNARKALKKGHFLCETSSSTEYCLKTKQLCDTSTGNARCICKEGWKGSRCQELIDEPVSIPPTRMPTSPRVGGTCIESRDCAMANSYCFKGLCRCESGYTPRKGNCINTDECKDSSNGCDRNSECIDTEGSFECRCKVGFEDVSPTLPGRQCQQMNECNLGMHNCDAKTQVCVDRRPPEKWECVERTPAPTPLPTRRPTPSPTFQSVICDSPALQGVTPISDIECLCSFLLDEADFEREVVPYMLSRGCKRDAVAFYFIFRKDECATIGIYPGICT